MANRTIQQKILKRKRRGRYARFSGATTKTITRTVDRLEHIDDDKVRLKKIEVYVGLVSLSKQVPKGSGPNQERMQTYYARLDGLKEVRTLAEVFGLVKDKRYAQIWWDTPKINKVNLVSDHTGRLDLYFHGSSWFFVDLDFKRKIIKRSREYGSRNFAMMKLQINDILWVEQIPMESLPA